MTAIIIGLFSLSDVLIIEPAVPSTVAWGLEWIAIVDLFWGVSSIVEFRISFRLASKSVFLVKVFYVMIYIIIKNIFVKSLNPSFRRNEQVCQFKLNL